MRWRWVERQGTVGRLLTVLHPQTLVAPARRRSYDWHLRRASARAQDAGFQAVTPAQEPDSETAAAAGPGTTDPYTGAYALFVERHGIVARRASWTEQVAREYNEALFHAYMGPRVRCSHRRGGGAATRPGLLLPMGSPMA